MPFDKYSLQGSLKTFTFTEKIDHLSIFIETSDYVGRCCVLWPSKENRKCAEVLVSLLVSFCFFFPMVS